MRAERRRSVHLPRECPLELTVEAQESMLARSGTRRYHCSPLEVELPTIRVDLGRVHVRLPTLRLHAEVRLPPPGAAGAAPLPDAHWRVEESTTEAEVTVEPPRVTVTPVRVHAVPESEARRRFWFETRWNDLRLATTTSATTARMSGCLHEE